MAKAKASKKPKIAPDQPGISRWLCTCCREVQVGTLPTGLPGQRGHECACLRGECGWDALGAQIGAFTRGKHGGRWLHENYDDSSLRRYGLTLATADRLFARTP